MPWDQMNFFGIASSGIDPSSLRKGPFSKFTFKQSLKQTSALPTRAFWSTLKGKLTLPPHYLKHASVVLLTCCANLSERNVSSISYCSLRSSCRSTFALSSTFFSRHSSVILQIIYYQI
jgi:hypothetical protein